MMIDKKIGIIGCGHMGEALLARLSTVMEKSTSLMVSELDASRREAIHSKYRMIVEIDNSYLAKYSDIIILAVKPKDVDPLLGDIGGAFSSDKLIISMAAGITTKHIERLVGKSIAVIRVMPNMAAIVGESISSLTRGAAVKDAHMAVAKEIFAMLGDVIEVDEKLLDAVTAISGSGPAYFFYFIEGMMKAAKALGLDPGTAEKLVLKTAKGSMRLLDQLKEDPAALRARVASKGGTTEAALKVFESKRFHGVVKAAVAAAWRRSKELSRKAGS